MAIDDFQNDINIDISVQRPSRHLSTTNELTTCKLSAIIMTVNTLTSRDQLYRLQHIKILLNYNKTEHFIEDNNNMIQYENTEHFDVELHPKVKWTLS